jgi:energy-coupling factor transporter ATP-binding protein EcfA2
MTSAHEQVFCSPEGPEVFSGIVHGNQVWIPDPFDVQHIHAEARVTFQRLLDRASSTESLPVTGKTLLLLGDGGSGKTHLMRAFRAMTHAQGYGYCGYLQMTSRSDNYARYVLANVVDSLELPYQTGSPTTGAQRLARALLDSVLTVPASEREQLLRGDLPEEQVIRLVNKVASTAIRYPRFSRLDLDLLRAVLFLLPPDGLVHSLALKWLRCEDLSRFDRESLGDLVPRPGPEWPLRTVVGLGRLMQAVHGAALVLLVDQMEEIVELGGPDGEGSILRSAINTLVDIADALPNAVVVLACLSDLFELGRQYLPGPKLDRLLQDPEPVRLVAGRTPEQIEALVGRRLELLYNERAIELDPAQPTAPLRPEHLSLLAGLRTRDVLDWCRRHRERCIAAGAWVEPEGFEPLPVPVAPAPQAPEAIQLVQLSQEWNDYLAGWAMAIGLAQETLADLLAWTARACLVELPWEMTVEARLDGRFVDLVMSAGEAQVTRLVAICDTSAKGGALERQIEEVIERAGSVPALFVRSTEFPRNAKSRIAARLVDLCKPIGMHRKLVVQNADWRAMEAFRSFHELHGEHPGFLDWQRAECPLSGLLSVRVLLELDDPISLLDRPRTEPPVSQPPALAPMELLESVPLDQPPLEETWTNPGFRSPIPVPSSVIAELTPVPSEAFQLGWTRGVSPMPVELDLSRLAHHAVLLGNSGSGKTTVALALVEALLLQGVGVVVIDRKGDLCRYADPDAWTEPELAPDRWARRAELRSKIDVQLFTPGEPLGRPLGLPVAPPHMHMLGQAEREQLAGYIAASIGGMMGYRSKSHQPKIVILQKALAVLGSVPDEQLSQPTVSQPTVTLPALISMVRERDRALLLEVDGLDDRHFRLLAEDLQTFWLRYRRLLEADEMLDLDRLLGRGGRTTRLSIVSTRGLGDEATIDFWMAQLLVTTLRWGMEHPSSSLQAVLLLDEAERYLPAGRQPSPKAPLEYLLKRARSSGLGLLLASGNPGEFDYRYGEQISTWLVGRVNQRVALAKLEQGLDLAHTLGGDRMAGLATGQFVMLSEGEALPVDIDLNLIPPRQLPEEDIVTLARQGRAAIARTPSS